MDKDLKIIKNNYGEQMSHFCRSNFCTILDYPGLLPKILLEHFDSNNELFSDLNYNKKQYEFINYIYKCANLKEPYISTENTSKTPQELLKSVGYTLYECQTEDDIQSFKKYYQEDETICTFFGGRLKKSYVFFAVKNNVDDIRRENFKKPEREDEYGTSVISIQFSKNKYNVLLIMNRYNHTVKNSDATFYNNLENICPGLTKSFEIYYGLRQKFDNSFLELPEYVYVGNKFYKYNYKINHVYYCQNNIIVDKYSVYHYPKESHIIIDDFIIDLSKKSISGYKKEIYDSFVSTLNNIKKIKCISYPNSTISEIIITPTNGENIIIRINNKNQIVGYINNNVTDIGDNFLINNNELAILRMKNVKTIGNNFMIKNKELSIFDAPKLESTGSYFLYSNNNIDSNSFISNQKRINLSNIKKLVK